MTVSVELAEKAVTLAELENFYTYIAQRLAGGHGDTATGRKKEKAWEAACEARATIQKLIEDHEALQQRYRTFNQI